MFMINPGTKPSTTIMTIIGVQAIHSVIFTSSMAGSFSNSSVGTPKLVR